MGCMVQESTPSVLISLEKDKQRGLFGKSEAKLSFQSFANTDIDFLLANEIFKCPSLVFNHCLNGGGVSLVGWYGIKYFPECKYLLVSLRKF